MAPEALITANFDAFKEISRLRSAEPDPGLACNSNMQIQIDIDLHRWIAHWCLALPPLSHRSWKRTPKAKNSCPPAPRQNQFRSFERQRCHQACDRGPGRWSGTRRNLLPNDDTTRVMLLDKIAKIRAAQKAVRSLLRTSSPDGPPDAAAHMGAGRYVEILVANYVGSAPYLPAGAVASIAPLLESNRKKAAISIAIWLPYLLLSKRVNVTYRWRQSA